MARLPSGQPKGQPRMVGLEGETSNTLFDELERWEKHLSEGNLTKLMGDQAHEE